MTDMSDLSIKDTHTHWDSGVTGKSILSLVNNYFQQWGLSPKPYTADSQSCGPGEMVYWDPVSGHKGSYLVAGGGGGGGNGWHSLGGEKAEFPQGRQPVWPGWVLKVPAGHGRHSPALQPSCCFWRFLQGKAWGCESLKDNSAPWGMAGCSTALSLQGSGVKFWAMDSGGSGEHLWE